MPLHEGCIFRKICFFAPSFNSLSRFSNYIANKRRLSGQMAAKRLQGTFSSTQDRQADAYERRRASRAEEAINCWRAAVFSPLKKKCCDLQRSPRDAKGYHHGSRGSRLQCRTVCGLRRRLFLLLSESPALSDIQYWVTFIGFIFCLALRSSGSGVV